MVTTIEALHQLAHKRVSRMYCDGAKSGSRAEGSHCINNEDSQSIKLRQRVPVNKDRSRLLGRLLRCISDRIAPAVGPQTLPPGLPA